VKKKDVKRRKSRGELVVDGREKYERGGEDWVL
jgi:hypothetical protein